jgi:hypothetical protein
MKNKVFYRIKRSVLFFWNTKLKKENWICNIRIILITLFCDFFKKRLCFSTTILEDVVKLLFKDNQHACFFEKFLEKTQKNITRLSIFAILRENQN